MNLRLACLAVCLSLCTAKAYADRAEQEINHLISQVEQSGCIYIRNDSEHDAESAADHLRLKYQRGGRYVDTAEHFIDRLASESSWTGKPYELRCGGVTEPAADWLYRELHSYRDTAESNAGDN